MAGYTAYLGLGSNQGAMMLRRRSNWVTWAEEGPHLRLSRGDSPLPPLQRV